MFSLTNDTAALVAAFCAAFEPQELLPIYDWAEGRVVIPPEASTSVPGPLSWAGFAYCREPLNRLHFDDPCKRVTVKASSQSGKSNIGVVWVSWIIDQRPRPIGLGLPSLAKVREFSSTKLQPVFDATPCLVDKVLPTSTRSERGSTTTDKAFIGGSLKIFAMSSPLALQTSSFGALWMTESPGFLADVGGRGSPIHQARARMDGWDIAGTKELHESTPGEIGACPITQDYEASEQNQYYMPCPHCDAWHRWEWESFVVPARATDAPTITAPCCGVDIEERHKPAMVAGGLYLPTFESADPGNPAPGRSVPFAELAKWAARDTEGREPGYYFWQAHSPLKTWASIAAEYRESQKSSETRATFRQQKLGLASDPAAAAPEHTTIAKAAERIGVARGIIPSWAACLVGAADIQGDRIEWAAYAIGPNNWARIDRGVIEIDPLTRDAWSALALVVGRSYGGPRIAEIGFDAFFVDSGGKEGVSPQVYQFTRARGTRAGSGNVRSLKGSSYELPGGQAVLERALKVRMPDGRKVRHHIVFVDGYVVKRQVYGALAAFVASAESGELRPGALLLERDSTVEDAQQITAERLVLPKAYRPGARGIWESRYPRNEQLDMAVYAWSAAQWRGIWAWDADRWASEFLAKARPAADVTAVPLEQLWNKPAQPEAAVAGETAKDRAPRGSRFASIFGGDA